MINIPTRIAIGMTALAVVLIVLASISFADNQARKEDIKLTQNDLARQMEIWETSRVMFRYNAAKIKVRDLEAENKTLAGVNKILVEDLIVSEWGRDYAYLEVKKMAYYIEIMQAIADLAGIQYPLYSVPSEEE